MNALEQIRSGKAGILAVGNHPQIVQSILDFDYLCGRKTPSVVGIIAGTRKAQKFFFGRSELLIPCFPDLPSVPQKLRRNILWMLNVQSGRRAFDSTCAFFAEFPNAHGGHIFAENVPERYATELIRRFGREKLIAGPSGVGLLVPGSLKLGAIGGTDIAQIEASKLTTPGSIAVISTSGGMTSELIRAVAQSGRRVSFAIAIGGDRFPIASLTDVLSLAQSDPETQAIVYFGELGGVDEYEIVELLKKKKLTKPVLAYVAGIIDEAFDEHMQFGHAKALVAQPNESARAKRDALRKAGATAPETFPEFLVAMKELPAGEFSDTVTAMEPLTNRRASILSTREVADLGEIPVFVKNKKLVPRKSGFAASVFESLLDRKLRSPITAAFADAVFELLIDHGGEVSGAVNTMISARAGKDLVSSLASGLLTIGPRFGGAVNTAAEQWLSGAGTQESAAVFVEKRTKGGKLLAGIGHRKYRVGIPDPRVAAIAEFAALLKKHPHYEFARAVEQVTTAKNGSLILNVDGVIAALALDILAECEKCSREELRELADAEFFNALFVIPRSVGFIAHFMEQKKNDEGLFRLPKELLFVRKRRK
ncbi:MAG TPA: citrate/2-methylcitrate synthase [Candidatus Paceibacterota bacterium]|jgi:ATP citrate (pro-S)-lyase|nr:citrate/2-methylcitrate synthase [Candidatus Paceibacterota bacterium]